MKKREVEPAAINGGAAGPGARALVERCVEVLGELVDLDGWAVRAGGDRRGPRTGTRLELRQGGQQIEFAVEVKRWIRTGDLGGVVHRAQELRERGKQLLVCAERIPPTLAEQLREHEVAYLDLGGNAFLWAPGLYVLIAGRRAARVPTGRRDLTGTDVRLLGVFLRDPDAGQLIQKDLATRAGIALGAVGRGRAKLAELGILRRAAGGHWTVIDRAEGLRRFGDGWNAVLRGKLEPRRYRLLHVEKKGGLERRLAAQGKQLGCLLGGELAAAHATRWLRTEHATLHVPPGEQHATARALDLVPDPEGPITVLQRYGERDEWNHPDRPEVPMVPLLLIWAECITIPDERVAKTARLLHDTLMEPGHE